MISRRACFRNLIPSLRTGSTASKLRSSNCFTSRTAPSLQPLVEPSPYSDDEYADVDWDNLGFGLIPTDYMYTTKCSEGGNFEEGHLSRYGNIELSPSAGVLNYGQGLFEGTKAYRRENGRLCLFRPDQNAIRMQVGAERMCMPSPSIHHFVEAVKQTALANKRWIPPPGKGSLYIRPLLMGSGPVLGLGPAPECTFLIYACPVGNYFKVSAPLNLFIDDEYHRATRGGAGGVKAITNYSPDNVISTPATGGTILEGVTRKSIIDIALDHGYQVKERCIPVEEVMEADEVFCTGTAVGVAAVGSITYQGKRVEYKSGDRCVSQELLSMYTGIQKGHIEDKKGWILEID
ncbi:Branched-chain-amino-acid aminotransferase 2, chloroplastic [Vitis vinifera]|uniref:Branched-chain-amino-acid aminotransferase 2, chloroplastic n=1 Tax=Vitis vinifera TaxID=29760 RepID=A0A438F8S6_VITVI|nr:Branched-chain-amino-acid aminotransferase 2, chloroplastic [Vitis vinifera]